FKIILIQLQVIPKNGSSCGRYVCCANLAGRFPRCCAQPLVGVLHEHTAATSCRARLAFSGHKIMKKKKNHRAQHLELSILDGSNPPAFLPTFAQGSFESPLIFELGEISAMVLRRSFGVSFTPPRQVS
ncbi:hypothetical protein X777_09268, partial [Ooceraea biroi]